MTAGRDLDLAWGPYKDYAALNPGDGCEAAWGPLFAALEPQGSETHHGSQILSHMRLVECVRNHAAPVRPPWVSFSDKVRPLRPARPRRPFRLAPQPTGQDRVVARKGRYSVIFEAHSLAALLKLVELNDGEDGREGPLLLMLLRDRLSYRGHFVDADRVEVERAGASLLAGEACPEGLVLARELVQGRDAFLALRYEALRGDGQAQPYHLALAHERRALLALLEPLAPLLTRKMRQEMDL